MTPYLLTIAIRSYLVIGASGDRYPLVGFPARYDERWMTRTARFVTEVRPRRRAALR